MKPLTLGELMIRIQQVLKRNGAKALDFPVVLGDDEEVNGVHEAWFAEKLTKKSVSDLKDVDYDGILSDHTFLIS